MDVDGEEYVVKGRLQWGSLVFDSAASIVLAWVFYVSDWIGFVYGALETALGSAGAWISDLIYQVVTLPSNAMTAAWQTAAEFIGNFGFLGYVVAIVLVVVTLELAVSTILGYVGWSE